MLFRKFTTLFLIILFIFPLYLSSYQSKNTIVITSYNCEWYGFFVNSKSRLLLSDDKEQALFVKYLVQKSDVVALQEITVNQKTDEFIYQALPEVENYLMIVSPVSKRMKKAKYINGGNQAQQVNAMYVKEDLCSSYKIIKDEDEADSTSETGKKIYWTRYPILVELKSGIKIINVHLKRPNIYDEEPENKDNIQHEWELKEILNFLKKQKADILVGDFNHKEEIKLKNYNDIRWSDTKSRLMIDHFLCRDNIFIDASEIINETYSNHDPCIFSVNYN